MRKYYTQRSSANKPMKTQVKRVSAHWDVLYAYASGHASELGFDIFCRIHSICKTMNGQAYLDLASEFDAKIQSYTALDNPEVIFVHRQIACFLKKFPFAVDELNTDPKAAAIEKWQQAEEQCKETNYRLRKTLTGELPGWVTRAQSLISDCLGDLTPDLLMKIIRSGTHGPGATLSSKSNRTTPYYKYVDFPYTVTKSASSYAIAAISSCPRWMEILENSGRRKEIPLPGTPLFQKEIQIFWDCVDIAENDKITFVPKDARTERPIAISSSLNMFLQLGVSQHLVKKLKRVGVDLTNQERNRELAYQGARYSFLNGEINLSQFSTIDLASASDTISLELVRLLLPAEWYALLADLRHEAGDLGEESLVYEKFSAMGNGYTFALESLIFWALTRAVAWQSGIKGRISVYGDDIICPSVMARRLQRVFYYFGFTVNSKKSAWSGLFRESCGKHYHNSSDVTPFYLREPVTRVSHVIRILNRLLMWSSFKDFHMFTHEEISEFHNKWSKQIPRNLRGGNDPEQSDSLVTPERPHSHFVRKVSKKVQVDQSAALAFWFTTRVEREVVHNNVIDLPTCISIPREYFSWGFTDAVCVPCSTYKAMLMWQKDFFPSLYEPSLYDPKVDKGPALAPVSVRSNRTSWF